MFISKETCKELTDSEIVRKAIEDIDYFSCLYQRYEAMLLRYIKRISAVSEEEAQDILQDSFIKIWRNLNAYDQHLKLSSWLYRIVHNEAVSYWRKSRAYHQNQTIRINKGLAESIPVEIDLDEEKEEGAKMMLTHQVLDLLPRKYKEVLVLKFFEKMSYEEISDVLKIPEGTVATRINRAKKAFQKMAGKQHISFSEG